ncbi:hypothetical protein [Pedobacter antarcticus]|uniref:hypothetical protein n=1 Tax=Pedobacter antarcticus TaxID=34086 RepID=UPI00292D7240|nr:hypothetical protein [Pedobacter antarcticus]
MKSEDQIKYDFFVKAPGKCTSSELVDFHSLVQIGGKVPLKNLPTRIQSCVLLAFCYLNKKPIGISAIKKPSRTYKEKIILKAGIDRIPNALDFEIGYSVTLSDFRKKGISSMLKTMLLEDMQQVKGTIFSTTAIESSKHFLKTNGFIKLGKPYDGEYDKGICYYELSLGDGT